LKGDYSIEKIYTPPCSYQGGKQRIASDIVTTMFANSKIDDDTLFYDICCGSGAITLELINRGIHPSKITMIDNGCYGAFWQSIANSEFDLKEFREEIDKLPDTPYIQQYLQELSDKPVDEDKKVYHYLLLQSGAFGSKQIWEENGKWKNNTFRSYWMPTETSNRRSPVNPMMPMPETLYSRVENIVDDLSGIVNAINADVFDCIYNFDELNTRNIVFYIDPPYINTTTYQNNFDVLELEGQIWNNAPIYISEGSSLIGSRKSWCISQGRSKGNISGNSKKKPTEEWLNLFEYEN
jgi:site-specific DNA-adenine methylase